MHVFTQYLMAEDSRNFVTFECQDNIPTTCEITVIFLPAVKTLYQNEVTKLLPQDGLAAPI